MTTTLTAQAIRIGEWWAIDVPEIPNLHTQTRRLDQVEAMVRDAAALLTDRPESDFTVEVAPVLSSDDEEVIRSARVHGRALVDAEKAAAVANREAVARLRREGLTVRDVATIMGISPQRVSQLAS